VNVQDLVKRHFWIVGALTVTVCAFFGGRAVAHIVEGKALTDASKAPKVQAAPRANQPATTQARSKAGKPLADRNIFCSECLPVVAEAAPSAMSSDGVPMTSLPLSLIATFVSDEFKQATVLNTSTQAQGGYVIGSEIPGAGKVVKIDYKYVDFENTGAGKRVERISLLGEAPAAAPPPAVAAAPVDSGPKDEMTAAIDSGIKKVDDTTFEVDRALIDKLLANPLAASKGARVTPSIKNGKPNGIKLYAIRPSSIYSKLGLSNGDTIHSINGFELDSLDKGLEVYQKVKDATGLQVSVTRRGKPVTLNYSIK
jgi:general secretion pathway protein C